MDLLADGPVIALHIQAEIRDDGPLAQARVGLPVDGGDPSAGHPSRQGSADVGVLAGVAHHREGPGPRRARGGAAGLVAETEEVAFEAHVGPGRTRTAQHEDVPGMEEGPDPSCVKGGCLHVAVGMGGVVGRAGGVVAMDVVHEIDMARIGREGDIGVRGHAIHHDLNGKGMALGRASQGADLHRDLLDVRPALGDPQVPVVVDLGAAEIDLDARAEPVASEALAEDGEEGPLAVLSA